MAPLLTDDVVNTVKATVPVLTQHGVTIITAFYRTLFDRYPQVKRYFNMDRQAKGRTTTDGTPAQVVSLARAVLAYAKNIDRLDVLLPTVKSICNKHVSRGVLAPHYDAVGECLIDAIGQVLGDAATPNIVDAWARAYAFLADLFVKTEQEVFKKAADAAGYEGFTTMTVTKIVPSDEDGRILYVIPQSGTVPKSSRGQYVAVTMTDVPLYGETMLTAEITEESEVELRLTVPNNGEAANSHFFATVKEGTELSVGMPCGNW